MKAKLRCLFLDYFNNFLTIERFAEYYEMDLKKARRVVDLGMKLHEERVASLKGKK